MSLSGERGTLSVTRFVQQSPVTVLFDDYTTRNHYIQAVETFVRPAEIVGRMARFEIEPTASLVSRMTEITGLMSRPD